MNNFETMAFLPELVMMAALLALFVVSLGTNKGPTARRVAIGFSFASVAAVLLAFGEEAVLFNGAYSVDQFSQVLKLALACGFAIVLLLSGDLPDIREDVKPEYYMFLAISVSGLMMLVSSVDLITMVIALEVSSYPLYLMIPMRRERAGQRGQMESAIKYMMFGIAANGIMFFGMSYLFGITGTTLLPKMMPKLQAMTSSPIVITGMALTFAGFYYKLAVFPFHFWTPDVYQGASNETAGLIASLPKLGAVAVLVRLISLATPDNSAVAWLLAALAIASMFYGNLIALAQKDFKRLLGFSGIAHAGYALLGFVALDTAGFSAAIYYVLGYVLMVLACFIVICKVSADGVNVGIEELAGLHHRSPMLAITLAVGVFALAGIPPFVGFMGKLTLLSAALNKGFLALVIIAVINTAIAAYYYLAVIREAWFRDAGNLTPIRLDLPTRASCILLIAGIIAMGIVPGRLLDTLSVSVAKATGAPTEIVLPALTAGPHASH